MEIKTEKRNRKVQYLSALAASMASLCIAATASWPTPVIYKFQHNEIHFNVTEDEMSWINAMSPVGFSVGNVLTRYLADLFGRKTTIMASSLPLAIGSLTALFGWNAWFLYVARFIWGVGTGMVAMIVPIYIAEIASKDIRGRLTTFTRVLGNLGALIIIAGGSFVSYTHINIFLFMLPPTYLVICCFIPESPYYYLKDGRTNEARKVMLRLHQTMDSESVNDEVSRMQAHVKEEMSRGSSICELLSSPVYRKSLIISAGLQITQIMTGVNTIKIYLGGIVKESGITLDISIIFIIFGVINFIIGLISSVMVDHFRRRPLFLTSSLSLGLCLFLVGVYYFLEQKVRMSHVVLHPYAIVAFVGIVMSAIISSLGVTPLACIIPAEMFPMNVKSLALSIVNIFGAVLGSIVFLVYQRLKDTWDLYGVFWCYASVAIVGGLFTYLLLPETKGKSLDEIQKELHGRENYAIVYNKEKDVKLQEFLDDNKTPDGDVEMSERL